MTTEKPKREAETERIAKELCKERGMPVELWLLALPEAYKIYHESNKDEDE